MLSPRVTEILEKIFDSDNDRVKASLENTADVQITGRILRKNIVASEEFAFQNDDVVGTTVDQTFSEPTPSIYEYKLMFYNPGDIDVKFSLYDVYADFGGEGVDEDFLINSVVVGAGESHAINYTGVLFDGFDLKAIAENVDDDPVAADGAFTAEVVIVEVC